MLVFRLGRKDLHSVRDEGESSQIEWLNAEALGHLLCVLSCGVQCSVL